MSMSHAEFLKLPPEAQAEARQAAAVIRKAMTEGWFLQLMGRSQIPAPGVQRIPLTPRRIMPDQVLWLDEDGFGLVVSANSGLPQATGLARS
jgi:hypothetical protein